jgi:hypothetical protein
MSTGDLRSVKPAGSGDPRRAPDEARAGMFTFDLAMLQGKAPGRRPMLVLVGNAGLVLGAWIGRDLRREKAANEEKGPSVKKI